MRVRGSSSSPLSLGHGHGPGRRPGMPREAAEGPGSQAEPFHPLVFKLALLCLPLEARYLKLPVTSHCHPTNQAQTTELSL